MKNKTLMKGNIALCEGAIAAGLKAFFGYPITPQNEVPAHMSKRMIELSRVFLQAESEVAAINMVLGAAAAGFRVMTSSSSPGISLKQEGISYIAGSEIPCVIANVQRGGPGLGNISGSQGDYFQSVKGGGHGDYRLIVLAPASVQEMYDFAYTAFEMAEKYRNPVMILSDGVIGQMMEPIVADKKILDPVQSNAEWVLSGCKGRAPRELHSLFMREGALEEHNWKLKNKHDEIEAKEARAELIDTEDADIIMVAYGISSRIAKTTAKLARSKGIKAGVIRPVTLWPFPSVLINKHAVKNVKFLVLEMSTGQMIEDVRLAVEGKSKVEFLGRPGGGIFSEEEVLEKLKKL